MKVVCVRFLQSTSARKVAELCLRLSPQIALRADEALFIEYGKTKRLYSERNFLARLQVILKKINVQAAFGLGADITDALARAKYAEQNIDRLPLAALLDFADPFNKDAVAQKYIQKMILSFADLGIKNIEEFKRIPLKELTPRFGPVAILCRQRLSFETSVPWPYWKPDEIISEKSEFPYFEFYGELEPLLFELKKQLDSIFQRLWARARKAQKIRVRIFCETTSLQTKPFRQFDFEFLFAQSATKGALNIIKERLARDFTQNPITTPIEGLETVVTEYVTGSPGQKNLLHNHEEIAEQQQALLAQLSEIHGRENIFYASAVEDRRPERSWKKNLKVKNQDNSFLQKIPLRPTHLVTPRRIEVTAGYVHLKNKKYEITEWHSEVERISGAWHDDVTDLSPAYERNYHCIEIKNDQQENITLCVFQTPDQKYYLHGYFG